MPTDCPTASRRPSHLLRVWLGAGLLSLLMSLAFGCGIDRTITSDGQPSLQWVPEPHLHTTGEGCGVVPIEEAGGLDTFNAALCSANSAKYPCAPPQAGSVEGYASYVGQSTCSSTAKPGVVAFKDLVLKTYPCTGNFGIVRGCSVGGKSEHKEGRAWDWKVYASNQGHIAQAVIDWLLKSRNGVSHALARRVGLMYMIWNRKIWKSYQASKGWQRYTGSNPHTDHIHFSFSWAGARKQTSFWKSSCSSTCKPACVSSTKIRGKDCGVGDCAAYGAKCVDDKLGVRCYSAFCPPLGTKKFCHDGKIGSCKDGKVTFTNCPSSQTCTGGSSPVCKPKNKPIGYLDKAGCDVVSGWTQDPDHKTTSIDAHVYFNGPSGDKSAKGISTKADVNRADLCKTIGSCKHGFALLSPYSLHDGKGHPIHAYGIDVDKVGNAQLKNSPKELKCSPNVPQGYVKRHIINQASYKGWKVSSFWDKLPLNDSQIGDLEEGILWPTKPVLVKVDGSDTLWLIDGGFKRKAPKDWKKTWRFDEKAIQTWSQAELDKAPTGPDLHGRIMYVVEGSGAAYMLDAKLPNMPTAPAEPTDEPTPDAGGTPSPDGGADEPASQEPPQAPDSTSPPTPDASEGTDSKITIPPQGNNGGSGSNGGNNGVTELPSPGQAAPTMTPQGVGCQIGGSRPSELPLGGLALLCLLFATRRKRS